MGYYFDDRESASCLHTNDPEKIIRLMAAKYMGDNPVSPFVWRTFDTQGIRADRSAGYILDFDERFPESREGDIAFAIADLYCPAAKGSNFTVSCFGPVRVWLNEESVFVSNGGQERDGQPVRFSVTLKEGYNRFLFRCEKTSIGFGCIFRNAMPQWEPCNYIMPFSQRKGEAGFLYTAPSDHEPADLSPCFGDCEESSGLTWLPEVSEERISESGMFYAWTYSISDHDISLSGAEVILADNSRPDSPCLIPEGRHELLLRGELTALRGLFEQNGIRFACPLPVRGRCTPYLLLGPCEKTVYPESLPRGGAVYAGTVWRPDIAHIVLRPYNEVPLFGRWTYPLGVTLYGLLSSGRLLEEPSFVSYVHSHVRQVTDIHEYALWDQAHFGFPGVNQQICWLDALDDCGSFASLMLEEDGACSAEVKAIAERVAEYMLREQPRTGAGAFCRRDDTIWADDMYMSVPFLCRYATLTGSSEAMDLCAKQLLLYRDLLFMPEKKIMAHMMCLRHGKNNHIPWCRGNGWVIFSLSELLMKLDPAHPDRDRLISFFTELTRGYLQLQGDTGLWHQILDDTETYPEASSTAMMICAFCRGIRLGLYQGELRNAAEAAVKRAWNGLCDTAIDRKGNLYGVCQGSGFSFSRAYYRTLMWRFNDTHGIGIVMLAGVEIKRTAIPV